MTAAGVGLAVVLLALMVLRTTVQAARPGGVVTEGARRARWFTLTTDLEVVLALAVAVTLAPHVWDLLT